MQEESNVHQKQSDKELTEENFQHIRADIDYGIEAGLAKLKILMRPIIELQTPYTDSQITKYFTDNSNLIIEGFATAYGRFFTSNNEHLQQFMADRKEKLCTLLSSELRLNIRRKEIVISKVIKAIKQLTDSAEVYFDQLTDGFDVNSDQSRDDFYNTSKAEAIERFNTLVTNAGFSLERFWKYELESTLSKRVAELLKAPTSVPEAHPAAEPEPAPRPLEPDPLLAPTEPKSALTPVEPDSLLAPIELEPALRPENAQDDGIQPQKYQETDIDGGEVPIVDPTHKEFVQVALISNGETHSTSDSFTSNIVNLGIYIDDDWYTIGAYFHSEPVSHSFLQLFKCRPEILFKKTGVLLGAEKRRQFSHHFHLSRLMQEPSPRYIVIEIRGTAVRVCNEDIIAIFIKQSISLGVEQRGLTVGRIVFALPDGATSRMKERIRTAASVAGFKKVQILSTTLAAAFAYTTTLNEIEQDADGDGPKYFLVVNYWPKSFCIGLVEVGPDGPCVKSSMCSQNYTQGYNQDFVKYHSRMFYNQDVSRKKCSLVAELYVEALNHIKRQHPFLQDWMIANRSSSLLDNLLLALFGNIAPINFQQGPELGAAIAAEQLHATPGQETKLSNLILSFNELVNIRCLQVNQNQIPGQIYCHEFSEAKPATYLVTLWEEFAQDAPLFEACRYQFSCQFPADLSPVSMKVSVIGDTDGCNYLTLKVPPGVQATFVRNDFSAMLTTANPSDPKTRSGFDKIVELYKV